MLRAHKSQHLPFKLSQHVIHFRDVKGLQSEKKLLEHPDHANAGVLVKESAFFAGLKKIDTGQERFKPRRIIHYMTRYRFEPTFVVPIDGYFERKMEAVRAHASQFYRPDAIGEDETRASKPEFLDFLALRDRTYGAMVGATYGEPYYMRDMLRIEDPFKLWCRA